ncbi:MAG TPA: methyltransferase domain-containing protein [Gaiellaceae bacterium]|nr:methyltransferase domain-containing protein [Gaiellaceae bacterium]
MDDATAKTIAARLRAFYELRAAEEPERDPEARLRFRKAVEAAGLRAGERVLDLGAKRGGLAASIAAAGIDVDYTGVDLSEANVQAGTTSGARFVHADVTSRLPFDDGSFDCVFCLELLEHLTIPVALLCEIRRVLTETGRAVVSVPSPYSWVEVARELLGRHDPEGHLNAFTTPIMTNLTGLAGFRIERRTGTSIRIPKTQRLISSDSILARSRVYLIRPTEESRFAGRGIEP